MSLQAFDLAIDRFIKHDVPEEVGKLQRLIATAGLQKVVLKTPVDTGRARGGWMVSVDARTFDQPERLDKSGSAAVSEGLSVIGGAEPFTSIVIQNNVEYIEGLEDGGSTQAPAGMLAVTVAEIQQVFK